MRGWEWSIILAVLLATGIAVWLALYPDLPAAVKTPLVADITAIAGKATQVADIAGGGLIPYLFLVIQLIRSEVKDVIFVRNVEKRAAEVAERAAVVMEREAATEQRAAAVMEREEAVAAEREQVAAQAAAVAAEREQVAQREAAVVEQAVVAAERAAAAAEQMAQQSAAAAAEREQMAAVLKWAEEQGFNLPPGLATNGHNGNSNGDA